MYLELTDEQSMIVDTTRDFLEKEIYPHEKIVEKTGEVPRELGAEIAKKCKAIGFFAANFPEELGGCLLYTSPSPRDKRQSRMPSSA